MMDAKQNFQTDGIRIAVVDEKKCKPSKCGLECKKNCPVVRMGKFCIQVEKTSKIALYSEILCIGCGICTRVCPFKAVSIVNLPKELSESQTSHRYNANSFKLYRLPIPRQAKILGLVGSNGCGKTTAVKILAGTEKPNLGNYAKPPEWTQILQYFRGSELQNYFKKLVQNQITVRKKNVLLLILTLIFLCSVLSNLNRCSCYQNYCKPKDQMIYW